MTMTTGGVVKLDPADQPGIDAAMAVLRAAMERCSLYRDVQTPEVLAALDYLIERRAIGIGNARHFWETGLHPLRARRALFDISMEVTRGQIEVPMLIIVRQARARFFWDGLKLWVQQNFGYPRPQLQKRPQI